MTDQEIINSIHTSRIREPEIVNERTPTWAHVLTVCCVAWAIVFTVKALTL